MTERLKQWLGVSTLAAALSYGLLRIGYAQFYAPLGTTPEEAGLDKTDLLSQAVVGPAVLFVMVFAYVFILMMVVAVFAAVYAVPVRRFDEFIGLTRLAVKRSKTSNEKNAAIDQAKALQNALKESVGKAVRSVKWLAYASLPLALVLICWLLFTESRNAGVMASRGETVVRRDMSLGFASLPLLDVRAVPVEVHWKAADGPPSGVDLECGMYLGEANGTTLLYDSASRSLSRIPTADAVFELLPKDDLDQHCRTQMNEAYFKIDPAHGACSRRMPWRYFTHVRPPVTISS